MLETAGEGLWDLLKALIGKIKYGFLSKNQKVDFNLNQLQERYWFEQLSKESPFLAGWMKEEEELKIYLTSSKKLRRLLHTSKERQLFKQLVKRKIESNQHHESF